MQEGSSDRDISACGAISACSRDNPCKDRSRKTPIYFWNIIGGGKGAMVWAGDGGEQSVWCQCGVCTFWDICNGGTSFNQCYYCNVNIHGQLVHVTGRMWSERILSGRHSCCRAAHGENLADGGELCRGADGADEGDPAGHAEEPTSGKRRASLSPSCVHPSFVKLDEATGQRSPCRITVRALPECRKLDEAAGQERRGSEETSSGTKSRSAEHKEDRESMQEHKADRGPSVETLEENGCSLNYAAQELFFLHAVDPLLYRARPRGRWYRGKEINEHKVPPLSYVSSSMGQRRLVVVVLPAAVM